MGREQEREMGRRKVERYPERKIHNEIWDEENERER